MLNNRLCLLLHIQHQRQVPIRQQEKKVTKRKIAKKYINIGYMNPLLAYFWISRNCAVQVDPKLQGPFNIGMVIDHYRMVLLVH